MVELSQQHVYPQFKDFVMSPVVHHMGTIIIWTCRSHLHHPHFSPSWFSTWPVDTKCMRRNAVPANTKHLHNIYTMLGQRRIYTMLGQRCINVIQMFCVCWSNSNADSTLCHLLLSRHQLPFKIHVLWCFSFPLAFTFYIDLAHVKNPPLFNKSTRLAMI